MKTYLKILVLFFSFFISSCVNNVQNNTRTVYEKELYTSLGFALVYSNESFTNNVVNRKMKTSDFGIMHSSLRKNTLIKIINPINSKFIVGKVLYTATYPKIFNIVITKKISEALDLDIENPYVEIIELKKNKKFVAKKTNIFDEEKNVAEKAPVNKIKIDDLSKEKSKDIKKTKNNRYILLISDFYYHDTAKKLKETLIKTTKSKKIFIKKVNDNKYRLLVGPFNSFNALKMIYISLNNLGFEDLNIYIE